MRCLVCATSGSLAAVPEWAGLRLVPRRSVIGGDTGEIDLATLDDLRRFVEAVGATVVDALDDDGLHLEIYDDWRE